MWVRKSDIFTCHYDKPPGDVKRIFTTRYHPDASAERMTTQTYLASQYMAAEPSLPLQLLCMAEIISYLSSPLRSYPFLRPLRTASMSVLSRCVVSPSSLVCLHTSRESSRLFKACRASPSATSARKGIRSGGSGGGGPGRFASAFSRILASDAGVCGVNVNTLVRQLSGAHEDELAAAQ